MPKSLWGRRVSMFALLLGRLHISLVSLLRILSSFSCLVWRMGLHSGHRLFLVLLPCWGCVLIIFFAFLAFSMMVFFWMFHFREGTRWMPRYVYSLFCVKVGKGWFLKWIRCACMYALKIVGFKFDLFGYPVIVHLKRLRSRCALTGIFWSLRICGWICAMLSVRMARSLAYAMMLHVVGDVLKWYPMWSFSSHWRSGCRKTIRGRGLRCRLG